MPDIISLVWRWWKQILGVMLLAILVTGVVTFLKPKEYLSVTTAVPASSFNTDKASVFNRNIQALYSVLGTTDDLDLVLGTARLDTVYLAVTDQFNLYDHYKVSEKGEAARVKAAVLLKGHTKVMKSEYGELKVKVWDTDRQLAPQLANAIMENLDAIHRDLRLSGNSGLLETIRRQSAGITSGQDSVQQVSPADLDILREHNRELRKLQEEYELIRQFNPPVLIIVEKARAAEWPDKPKRVPVMAATVVLSFIFAVLTALVVERRKVLRR